MPPNRKMRSSAAGATPGTARGAQQRGIQAFGKISKAQSESQTLRKRKGIETDSIDQELCESVKKRKCDSIEEVPSQTTSNLPAQTPQELNNGLPSIKNLPHKAALPALKTRTIKQSTSRKRAVTRPAITETPTKGVRSIFGSFSLQSSSPSTRSSSPPLSRATTPPTSPPSSRSSSPVCEDLPNELQDLLDLHSSFLSALSLHYAHHGCLTPVDLREFNPSVSRIWRRRNVTLDDIQRLLGIAHSVQAPQPASRTRRLCLTDYGHGKICLEIVDGLDNPGLHRRPINEEALHTQLKNHLEGQWQKSNVTGSTSVSIEAFISALPLQPIKPCDSLSKLTPLLAKGQRRLEDLKAGAIRAQKSPSFSSPSPVKTSTSRPKLAASRSDSLLSRIRAKEFIQSTLPPPPSRTTLERKSALQRVEEVVPVLELLTAGSAGGSSEPLGDLEDPRRQMKTRSFTMPTLVQNLQMSLRNPISTRDAVRCVRLLAEIMPEWIGLKEVGSCTSVAVKKGGAVGREEMRKRVDEAMQAL